MGLFLKLAQNELTEMRDGLDRTFLMNFTDLGEDMALETLKGVKEIGGFGVLEDRIRDHNGNVDWVATDEARKTKPIFVDHKVNMLSFRIQNGPIKENGVNGCQVDTLIHAARHIIAELNKNFPCGQNRGAILHLDGAIDCLNKRTKDREARGVEGKSEV